MYKHQNVSRLPLEKRSAQMRPLPVDYIVAQPAFNTEHDKGNDEDEGIDLRYIWSTLKRHKFTILLVFLVVFTLNALSAFNKTPIYQATVTLELQPEQQRLLNFGVEAQAYASYLANAMFYKTQYELLKSRRLAEEVVNKMGLESRFASAAMANAPASKPFYAEAVADIKQLLRPLRDALIPPKETKTSGATAAATPEDEDEMINPATARFMGSRSIEPVEDSRLVMVTYSDPDPRLAAAIANGIADTYINMNMERRLASTRYAEKFLQEQLAQAKSKLEDAETQLVTYAEKKSIYNLGDKQPLISQQLSDANQALMEARKERIAAQSAYEQNQRDPGSDKASANPTLDILKQSLAKLQAEYGEKLGIYQDEYPLMRGLRSQMAMLENKIQQETRADTRTARDALKANYLAAKQKESQLEADVKQYKSDLLNNQSKGIGYNTLQREVETSRSLYEALLQRVKEVSVAGLAETSNISVVDSALIPSGPYMPNTRKDLFQGALLGLFLGIVIAFLWEYLDDRVKTFAELERQFDLPLLGLLPALSRRQQTGANYALLTQQKPTSMVAEASRSLCTCQDLCDHRLYSHVKLQQARQVLRSFIQERSGQ